MVYIEKNYDFNYFKEVFSLKNSWVEKNTPIMLMIKAMSFLKDKVDLGYFIAKQNITINKLDFNEIELKSFIEKSKKTATMDYLICSCTGCKKGNKLIEIKSTLIRKKNSLHKKNIDNKEDKTKLNLTSKNEENKTKLNLTSKNENINFVSKEFFRVITKEEVYKFSQITEDPNYIHKSREPVVQAMLILLFLEDYLALQKRYMHKCKITYINPILADKEIFLHWHSSNVLMGICQNKTCFKLVLE